VLHVSSHSGHRSFSEKVLSHVRRLYQELDDALKTAVGTAAGTMAVSEFLQTGPIIEAWQVLLSLKKRLSIGLFYYSLVFIDRMT
jgi:hypothetical protein